MELCDNCGNRERDGNSKFCRECKIDIDRENEQYYEDPQDPEELDNGETVSETDRADNDQHVQEQENKAGFGGIPTSTEDASKFAAQVEQTVAKTRANFSRAAWATKGAVAALGNPITWIAMLVVLVLFIVANATTTTYQTVGSIAVDGQETGAGVANGNFAKLAQRAVLLSQQAYKYPISDSFVAAHGGNPGRTNGNPWRAACPDIVNIIYGMPEHYIGNNGIVNAYQNYQRLLAAGMQAQSWWFPNTASPGAKQTEPPAGAIVQSTGTGPAGHTYVVLTDDGKVIDNTWNIHAGGPATGPGYRILDDRSRSGIRGWFLPPAEGYQGTFLDDDPMLPPPPEWAQGDSSSGGNSGPSTTPSGNPQEIAHKIVKSNGWSEADFTCLVKLWNRESNWRVDAFNPAGPAYGIPQALPGEKMASEGSDWRTNPETQIKWGLKYIKGRYTNPCGAWAHSESHNWY